VTVSQTWSDARLWAYLAPSGLDTCYEIEIRHQRDPSGLANQDMSRSLLSSRAEKNLTSNSSWRRRCASRPATSRRQLTCELLRLGVLEHQPASSGQSDRSLKISMPLTARPAERQDLPAPDRQSLGRHTKHWRPPWSGLHTGRRSCSDGEQCHSDPLLTFGRSRGARILVAIPHLNSRAQMLSTPNRRCS